MALKGVRVLDMSRLLPGPYATLLLADLGAEVIKIEDPVRGDYARFMGVKFGKEKNTVSFHALNRGKKSVALDLKKYDDLQNFFRLLETADVLMETFRPGVLEKLVKCSIDELQSRFPSLIICRISGYGQSGPLRLRAGHDVNYLARTGVLGIMKNPDLLPVQVADVAGGSWPAAFQIVSALYQKKNTGKGCVIDVAMADCALAMTLMPQADYALNKAPYGSGKFLLNGRYPCYQIYKCKEGYISCGALEPQFWRRFCEGLGRKDFIRKQMQTKAIPEIAACMQTKTAKEWMHILGKLDCCAEEVVSPEYALENDPQVLHRELTLTLDNGKGSAVKVLKTPIRMSRGMVKNDALCSDLGADTESLLRPKL